VSEEHHVALGKGKMNRISIVLVVRWKKGSHLDNGKPVPGALVDDDVANVRSLLSLTALETVNEAVEVVLQCGASTRGAGSWSWSGDYAVGAPREDYY
jgi:hypothetical protein